VIGEDVMEKDSIKQENVQNTMFIPLWGRAFASKLNPKILDDKEAIKIIDRLDYDFSQIEKSFGEFAGICYITRARILDDIIKDFIKIHPNASIVNIGAGLDTTFSRIDNGSIHWYNLDLPEVIEFRKKFIPDSERNNCLPVSVFDLSWFSNVRFDPADGILFFAAGVFYYFKENELKELFCTMAEHFPKGKLVFDAESKNVMKKSNRMVRKSGNKGAEMYFSVNKSTIFEKWSNKIKVQDVLPPFYNIPKNKSWKFSTRLFMTIFDITKMMKYIILEFE
jgi:O-methyltransferase involved in polyketide biosynthesis